MELPIGEILANLTLAAVILFMGDRERKELLRRIDNLEERIAIVTDNYQRDLRDWSGLDPRFRTWSPRAEGDTKRLPNLSEDERQKAIERMNE